MSGERFSLRKVLGSGDRRRRYEVFKENGQSINNILLLMTYQEACEIRDDLDRLISSEKLNEYSHINDVEFKRELTLSIYNEKDLDGYQDNIKKLILEQK